MLKLKMTKIIKYKDEFPTCFVSKQASHLILYYKQHYIQRKLVHCTAAQEVRNLYIYGICHCYQRSLLSLNNNCASVSIPLGGWEPSVHTVPPSAPPFNPQTQGLVMSPSHFHHREVLSSLESHCTDKSLSLPWKAIGITPPLPLPIPWEQHPIMPVSVTERYPGIQCRRFKTTWSLLHISIITHTEMLKSFNIYSIVNNIFPCLIYSQHFVPFHWYEK